jgi:hypothetical protein
MKDESKKGVVSTEWRYVGEVVVDDEQCNL